MGLIPFLSPISIVQQRDHSKSPVMGKPRGIRCARKMRNRRREQRWADLGYKKANLGTALKANPFGGASTLKESSSKKSELKPNSPTQPFESASEFSLSKTERKSLLSSQMTVALTTSKKTTRF